MARRIGDVAVIIPDASPVLTLARIERVDLLGSFSVPVRIVDQVHYEITKPENDPKGEVAAALTRLHNQIEIRRPRCDGFADSQASRRSLAQHDRMAADVAPGRIGA